MNGFHRPGVGTQSEFNLLTILIFLCLINVPQAAVKEITIETETIPGLYPVERHIPKTPKLCLALSGGGIRGLSHIGVLRALEEAGIKPRGIAGVSSGALVGGLYAAGFTVKEISDLAQKMDFSGVLLDEPDRSALVLARKEEYSRHLLTFRLDSRFSPVVPGAISPGQRLYHLLITLTLATPYRLSGHWDELPVSLRILSTDMVTGSGFVFDSGDVTPAIRASSSLPLIFDPLVLDSLLLIDGAITTNIPVEIARRMGGDVVVAVDATSPLRNYKIPYKPWQVIDQVTTILEHETDSLSMSRADFVISPNLGEASNIAQEDVGWLIESGAEATTKAIPRLKDLLRPPSESEDEILLPCREVIIPDGLVGNEFENLTEDGNISVGQVKDVLRGLYRDGSVKNAWAEHDSAQGVLSIHVERYPNFTDVKFTGDKLLPDSLLTRGFDGLTGKPLDLEKTRNRLEGVLRSYRHEGYPVAQISDLHFDDATGILTVHINPGYLSRIEFIGLDRVPESWLAKEIPLKIGLPITRRGVLKGMNNLYGTGLFRSVYPVLCVESDSVWVLEIHITEQQTPLIRFGLAYLGERMTRGFSELIYPSPFNYSGSAKLFASVGQRDDEYRITIADDKVLGKPLSYNLIIGYELRRRSRRDNHIVIDRYSELRRGGRLGIGVQAVKWALATLTARWEQHDNGYSHSHQKYNITAIGARLVVDTQDRYPYPNRGIRMNGDVETAFTYDGITREFSRLWGTWEGTATVIPRHAISLRIYGATAEATTPFDEEFRLGGMHSFPGLHLDEMIGTTQALGGLEYRFDLISRVLADSYIGLRWDIAGSWEDPEARLTRRDWMQSATLYFAFDTLFGPFQIQWGHLLPKGAMSKQDILFIQAGNQF